MRILPHHDVFVVYSQAEPAPFKLVRTLYDDLVEVGFTLPGYEEMDWFITDPSGEGTGDAGATKAPPKVNTPMLEAYFKGAKCVIVMARQLTAGVAVELETLAKDEVAPPVLAVVWGNAGSSHEALAPFATLCIARWRDAYATDCAHRLRGWVWLAVVLNDMLLQGPFGHLVIGDLLTVSRQTAAIVASCRRFPPTLREAARGARDRPRSSRTTTPRLPETVTAAAALGLWRYWNGGAALIAAHVTHNLPKPLSGALDAVRRRLDAVCAAIEDQFPGAMVLDAKSRAADAEARFRVDAAVRPAHGEDAPDTDSGAEGDEPFKLCMMRALQHAESPRTADLALRDFEGALQAAKDPKLGLPFRHNVLTRRAELLIKMERVEAALADLDEIIAAGAATDEYARFSAHYLRGDARYALGQWAGAIEDYGAVLADRRAPDATRLSARLRRGAAHVQAGDIAAARLDYQAVLADTRAAESTWKTARRNLDDLAGRS